MATGGCIGCAGLTGRLIQLFLSLFAPPLPLFPQPISHFAFSAALRKAVTDANKNITELRGAVMGSRGEIPCLASGLVDLHQQIVEAQAQQMGKSAKEAMVSELEPESAFLCLYTCCLF